MYSENKLSNDTDISLTDSINKPAENEIVIYFSRSSKSVQLNFSQNFSGKKLKSMGGMGSKFVPESFFYR